MSEFETRVCGIPCIVRVLSWEPYLPAKVYGPPEYCYPAEGGYGEWEILDSRGRPAPWLEQKMTDADRRKIESFLFDQMENRKDDYYD